MPSNVICTVLGCKETRTRSVFRSPHPGRQWDLFVAWLKATGNQKYLHINPRENYKKINICEAHFTQEEVALLKRKIKFCIPTLNLPAPLNVQFGIDYDAPPHASEKANKENIAVECPCKRHLSSPIAEAGPSKRQLTDNVVSLSKHSEVPSDFVEPSTSSIINADSVSSSRSSNKSADGSKIHTIIPNTNPNPTSRRLQVNAASIKRRLPEAKKVIGSQNVGQLIRNLTEMRNAHKKPQGRPYTLEEKMDSLIRLGFDLPQAATLRKLFERPQPSSPVSVMSESNVVRVTVSSKYRDNDIYADNSMDASDSHQDPDDISETNSNENCAENTTDMLQHLKDEEENIQEYHCRTCLNVADISTSSVMSDNLFLDKTIRDVIIFLVPEMDSKLKDDEVVCDDCLIVLESTTKFILKCLEAEAELTRQRESMNGRSDAEEYLEGDGSQNVDIKIEGEEIELVDVEHDYCVKASSAGEDEPFENVEDTNQNVRELNQAVNEGNVGNNIEIEYYDLSTFEDNVKINGNSETFDELLATDATENLEGGIGGIQNCAVSLKKMPAVVNQRCGTSQKGGMDNETFSCSTCSEIFTDKENYDSHLQVHSLYVCEICGKGFRKRDSLRIHKATHNDPNSFICEVCGKGFKEQGAMRSHQKTHEEEPCICDKCSKMFKSRRLLDIHIKYVHDKYYATQCAICGKLSRSEASLRAHVKLVHAKEKPFECNICHKKFGRSAYLQNHLMRHREGWGSDNCQSERRTGRRKMRLRYKIQDTGEPVPCKFCGQWYKDLVRLKRHLETHLKRYPCQFCPLTFPRNALCKRHEEIHRGGTVNFSRCNVCWKKFKTKEALDEHATSHNNPQHFCDLCGKTFNRKFLLSHHKLEHINIPDKEPPEEIIYDSLLEVGGLST